MIEVRPFEKLGTFRNEWLHARYHFSFSGYQDPNRMGLGPLRVWNDDRIESQTGFDPHPHSNMEIITYVRKGAISHQDSLGNRGRTEAGDIQVMSAGSGIVHAEYNLEDDGTTLFQIWLFPNKLNVKPRWEARAFPQGDNSGKLVVLASGRAGDEGALTIHQDAALLAATLSAGQVVTHTVEEGRALYLVPATGRLRLNGVDAGMRDGVVVRDVGVLSIEAVEEAEVVVVDVPLEGWQPRG
jgi:quercetin 2,3-dioxygenase